MGPAKPHVGRIGGRSRGLGPSRARRALERGQVAVFVALLLPVVLFLGSIVLTAGNWFTHARHLQTKVDAAAFAGGAAWGFPCGRDIDLAIETLAREYVGEHTAWDGTVVPSTYNQQVGGVGPEQIRVALNQTAWLEDGAATADFTDPAGSVCEAQVLDVKATEEDASLIWGILPLSPDLKRKARVRIEEAEGLTGLLPIAVRLPQPLSAAAVFYDEASPTKAILEVRPFRQVCLDPDDPSDCLDAAPVGLGQWTTEPELGDPLGSWASFPVRPMTGVVVATSVRPACGAGSPPAVQPCLETAAADWVGDPVDDFCRQAAGFVRCYDTDGLGASQTVTSGVHFIRGYPGGSLPDGPDVPEVRGAWLQNVDCPGGPYFNAANPCTVELHVQVDVGSCLRGPGACFDDPAISPPQETRRAGAGVAPFGNNVQVRYCVARTVDTGDVCLGQFGEAQDLNCAGGPGLVSCSGLVGIPAASRENSFAVEVRLRNTVVTDYPECQDPGDFKDNCRWFFTGTGNFGDSVPPLADDILDAPVQRAFMGDLERTTPLRWLRLTVDRDCDLLTASPPDRVVDGLTGYDAASQQRNATRCYVVDLGTAGGLARDQDEPPIAFNLGDNSSQRAYLDCDGGYDGSLANLKAEIEQGCRWPSYAVNKFDTSPNCPPESAWFTVPKTAPFDSWPPYRCVLTQTGNSSQVVQGFNQRLFGVNNNPNCPGDDVNGRVHGRNYWHRDNNDYTDETFAWDADTPTDEGDDWGNELSSDDPRLVSLFFTTYDSFTGTGNQVYPIVGFGNFYITGYGQVTSGVLDIEDPCDGGNDGGEVGAGNLPPPDLDLTRNTRWVWGHFVKDVTPAPFTIGGSGERCNPEASFMPCVAVLVE